MAAAAAAAAAHVQAARAARPLAPAGCAQSKLQTRAVRQTARVALRRPSGARTKCSPPELATRRPSRFSSGKSCGKTALPSKTRAASDRVSPTDSAGQRLSWPRRPCATAEQLAQTKASSWPGQHQRQQLPGRIRASKQTKLSPLRISIATNLHVARFMAVLYTILLNHHYCGTSSVMVVGTSRHQSALVIVN